MLNQYVKNVSMILLLAITSFTLGTGPALAGPGTLATEAGSSPSGGTFYANSPAGVWTYTDTLGATRSSNSGTALRKFVDKLPGLGLPGCTRSNPFGTGSCNENNLGQYIPLAQPATPPAGTPATGVDSAGATVPADYYELATVEYSERLHSDLPKATKLKGYVDVGNGKTPTPHYLGATILAVRDKPVRIKMENRLNNGLFLPLDTTYMGAGYGPPIRNNGTLCTAAEEQADPINCVRRLYSQNRIAIHLHGGHTPWISDGTPHQWFTPANETSLYKRGASFQNVPDMFYDSTNNYAPVASGAPGAVADPGPGFQTLYYTNQQSARLMFYHDHAFGTTRLNVYSGMAAGYLLVDPTIEDPLIANGTLPGTGFPAVYNYGIPLVIQDKTFVPADIAVQDTKWDTVKWGVPGDLWFPHVYETNQDPFFPGVLGANNFGRWDFGPWFWPPLQYCGQSGAPAPPVCIDLNNPKSPLPGQPVPYWDITATPEAFMDTALVNGTVYPYLDVAPQAYRFRILSAANDRPLNLQMYVSDPTSPGNFIQPATGMPTEVAMVPANVQPACTATSLAATPAVPSTCTCTAIYAPLGCFPATWPTDGRVGGVPDPQFAGPKFIQIGNESGWLPKPYVIDNQPVSYDYNRRNIVVLDILDKSLLLGPAERADVIVDFSAFAGKTIILYNDSPAPMPAFDVRYDYYTGDPNQLAFGGAAPTLPGYGPNTRTIMQFRVAAGVPQNTPPIYDAASPKLATLTSAITGAFNASQPAPIVPEVANGSTSNVYSTIFDNSLTFTPVGSPTATTVWFKSKAIQELWDPFGRMNATLGVELPKTNNTIQTTIPLGYNDPVTETLSQDGIQLWKVTHNGVDTHPVHFHLTDVQLINRVGWDGAIRPPDDNEVGWKETIRMKPLEDVVVALRPSMPFLPFPLSESSRLHDPSEPEGATLTLTSPDTGNLLTGPVTLNALENFGYEFVWHCHILGHEENDFMRPVVFTAQTAVPAAPVLTAVATLPRPNMVDLSWTDASTAVNAANYYQVQRAPDVTGAPGAFTTIATILNGLTYTDTSVVSNTTYWYQVVAFNSNGNISSNQAQIVTPNWNPTTIVLSTGGGLTIFDSPATINLSAATTTGAGVTISRVDFFAGAQRLAFKTVGPSPYTFTWSGVFPGSYILTAHAIDSTGAVIISNSIPITVNVPPPAQIVRTGTTYANVQLAYNAALTGDTIKVQTGVDTGTLLANRAGINVTISGGYDVGFVTNLGITSLHSKTTLNQGLVRFQGINIIP